jgi:hypothetical protein
LGASLPRWRLLRCCDRLFWCDRRARTVSWRTSGASFPRWRLLRCCERLSWCDRRARTLSWRTLGASLRRWRFLRNLFSKWYIFSSWRDRSCSRTTVAVVSCIPTTRAFTLYLPAHLPRKNRSQIQFLKICRILSSFILQRT